MMKNQPVTMRDVAKAEGVSLATVSRAIRANPDTAPEKYLHIQEIAKKMGYRPNPSMSLLIDRRWRNKQPHTGLNLGYIYDSNNISGEIAANEYQAFKKKAYELGYSLIMENIADFSTPAGLLKRLQAQGVEGLIVSLLPTVSINIDSIFEQFAAVSLGASTYQPNCPVIAHDEFFCTRAAWKTIEKKGYQRIGIILPKYEESATTNMRMGSALVCLQLTPRKNRIPVLFTDEDLSQDYIKILEWLDKYKPDMILGQTHDWAIEIEQHGLKLPEDIPFATSNLWEPKERGHIAGYFRSNMDLFDRAILLLNMMIRSGATGSERADLIELVKGHWVDGKTLPDIKSNPKTSPS